MTSPAARPLLTIDPTVLANPAPDALLAINSLLDQEGSGKKPHTTFFH